MADAQRSARGDPTFGVLAARAIEVLVTHNEPVSRDDLACALGISRTQAWAIANALEKLGYARLDDLQASVEATPRASDPSDAHHRDEVLVAQEESQLLPPEGGSLQLDA